MHARSGAPTCSISLPPPASQSLVGKACEVSNIDVVPKSADSSWSGQGFEQRDEPAVQICNPDSVKARISSCPSLGEGKEELSSEDLEPGSGDLDSPAQGAVDCGFVMGTAKPTGMRSRVWRVRVRVRYSIGIPGQYRTPVPRYCGYPQVSGSIMPGPPL